MSWKITHLRPRLSTHSVASSCQQAFGAGYTNRRHAALGFRLGSSRATPASRKILASDATEGTTSRPIARILSCTLTGPQPSPDCSSAARTPTACRLTTSASLDGLDFGRRDLGANAAAGPSTRLRRPIS
ncbi:hypothetical protein [Kribbella antiqua]|uniref:hypothetical protein n=1 Tax=Kribbella antiqua TaxID=2512217 RepID=UPI003BAE932B